jgi:carbohydrate kinase (thermoresistant glucokinase family)
MSKADVPSALLIMGVSGSGKSTVGAAVAQRLGWHFQDADSLHPPANVVKMARGEELDDADRTPWLAAVAQMLQRWQVQKLKGVIACSALKHRYRQQLIGAQNDLRLVYLHGDRALLAQRLQQRSGHFMSPSLLDSQLATLETPTPDEAAIVIDIGHSVEQQVRDILLGLQAQPERPAGN